MFQYCDQVCCFRARRYYSLECASLLRNFKKRAPSVLARTEAIRAEHAAQEPTFLSTKACCNPGRRGEDPSAPRSKGDTR